ncbi:unnamed protein product [Moneuplotes crassus]|uniref:DNA 3'-5' helicase n=1 Tax=Euplotes crassus TaxID=5936 RepID=A0AAD1Y961_EUPCR|nr:unnamed protein product [Moneuplotes crassus]
MEKQKSSGSFSELLQNVTVDDQGEEYVVKFIPDTQISTPHPTLSFNEVSEELNDATPLTTIHKEEIFTKTLNEENKNQDLDSRETTIYDFIKTNNRTIACVHSYNGRKIVTELFKTQSHEFALIVTPVEKGVKEWSKLLLKNKWSNEKVTIKESQDQTKIVVISAQKLRWNQNLRNSIISLCDEKIITRIIIDEAQYYGIHCKDVQIYTRIRELITYYKTMPLTILISSIESSDFLQIQANLRPRDFAEIRNFSIFPNASFNVKDKGKSHLEDLVELVEQKFREESGIIYCKTEGIAKELHSLLEHMSQSYASSRACSSQNQVRCYLYSLEQSEREEVISLWEKGDIQILIICSDERLHPYPESIRFIIHESPPVCIKDYYKDCYNVSKDGKPSYCILYSGLDDLLNLLKQLPDGDKVFTRLALEYTFAMINYCFCSNLAIFAEKNLSDASVPKLFCMRKILKEQVTEENSQEDCKNQCDNCKYGSEGSIRDITSQALQLAEFIANDFIISNTVYGCFLNLIQSPLYKLKIDILPELEFTFKMKLLLKFFHEKILKVQISELEDGLLNYQLTRGPRYSSLISEDLHVYQLVNLPQECSSSATSFPSCEKSELKKKFSSKFGQQILKDPNMNEDTHAETFYETKEATLDTDFAKHA